MATYVMFRLNTRDYAEWKITYDAYASMRTAAGLKEKHVLQDIGDPNRVTLILESTDLAQAQEFTQSKDLQEARQKAGELGQPDIYFLQG